MKSNIVENVLTRLFGIFINSIYIYLIESNRIQITMAKNKEDQKDKDFKYKIEVIRKSPARKMSKFYKVLPGFNGF